MWNDPPGGSHPVSAPDFLPREQLQAIQLQRLKSVVGRAFDHVALFRSKDKGATWANATGLVPSPFAGGDIMAAVCFPVGKDTTRLLVASGPKAGSAQVAYSDFVKAHPGVKVVVTTSDGRRNIPGVDA